MKYTDPFYVFSVLQEVKLSEHTDSLEISGIVEIVKINEYDIRLDPTPQNIAHRVFTELWNRGYTKFFGIIDAEQELHTRQYLIAYQVMVKDLLFKQFTL